MPELWGSFAWLTSPALEKVKRYYRGADHMDESEHGLWVSYDDFQRTLSAALQYKHELEELRAAVFTPDLRPSNERMAVLARFLRNQIALTDRPPPGCVQLNNEEATLCAQALEQIAARTSGTTFQVRNGPITLPCDHCGQSVSDHLCLAHETGADGWQSIISVPNGHELFHFWLVPKPPEESYVNTSGDPICVDGPGFLFTGKYREWSSLHKATHWQRLPASPSKTSCERLTPGGPLTPEEIADGSKS